MGLNVVLSNSSVGKYVYIFVSLDLIHFNVTDVNTMKTLLQHMRIRATLYIKHISYNFIINTFNTVANIYKKSLHL